MRFFWRRAKHLDTPKERSKVRFRDLRVPSREVQDIRPTGAVRVTDGRFIKLGPLNKVGIEIELEADVFVVETVYSDGSKVGHMTKERYWTAAVEVAIPNGGKVVPL